MKKKLIYSEDGASAIEFAMYIFIFTLLCGFIMDMSFYVVKKNNLDRFNNSLFSILRERSVFFDGATDISRNDLTTLKSIADRFLMTSDGSVEAYQLNIREITFSTNSTQTNKMPTAVNFHTDNINGCAIDNNLVPIADLSNLSVWGRPPTTSGATADSWYPVYEITLCIPGATSYFHRALGIFNDNLSSLYIRNAGLPRL